MITAGLSRPSQMPSQMQTWPQRKGVAVNSDSGRLQNREV